jgi:putative DNA-invertase from lambdoid prophage Rac
MFHIASACAELERKIIRERVKAGLANARRRGKKLGRPRTMVDRERAHELAAQGLSRRAIARKLGVSSST